MSIYEHLTRLETLTKGLFVKPLLPDIVARKKNSDLVIKISDSNIDKIIKDLDEDYYVDYHYWNYEYHSYEMLEEKFKESLKNKIKFIVDNLELVAFGSFINRILFHQMLVNMYSFDVTEFKKYLYLVNIDKNVILDLYIEYDYKLPYTENFLCFLERILDDNNSHKILNIIFSKDKEIANFDREIISMLLKKFNFGDINSAYLFIVKNNYYTLTDKLLYLHIMIDSYEDIIDQEQNDNLSFKNLENSLGFYLYSLNVENNLAKLYIKIIDLFRAKGGVKSVSIVDDTELDRKLKNNIYNENELLI